jgi:hypothetical protein
MPYVLSLMRSGKQLRPGTNPVRRAEEKDSEPKISNPACLWVGGIVKTSSFAGFLQVTLRSIVFPLYCWFAHVNEIIISHIQMTLHSDFNCTLFSGVSASQKSTCLGHA